MKLVGCCLQCVISFFDYFPSREGFILTNGAYVATVTCKGAKVWTGQVVVQRWGVVPFNSINLACEDFYNVSPNFVGDLLALYLNISKAHLCRIKNYGTRCWNRLPDTFLVMPGNSLYQLSEIYYPGQYRTTWFNPIVKDGRANNFNTPIQVPSPKQMDQS